MTIKKIPMTVQGAEQLREELKRLTTVERQRISQAIAEAREHGDLKENAEYHAAREEQGFIEGRIHDIEAKLSRSEVIDVTKFRDSDKVIFGATVKLFNLGKDEEVSYQIVGEDEADIKQGKISVTSPIARAIIGKKVDEIAEVNAPSGIIEYEVIAIDYI